MSQKCFKNLIKKAVGLSRVEYAFTGAAPISREVLEWFDVLGIKIIEVYGMTENLAYGVINLERKYFGSVGIIFSSPVIKATLFCPTLSITLSDSWA